MPQPSQYQARRLLELVSLNHTKASVNDHVERDHWARTNPPLRGLVFQDRATARHNLYTGHLCAVPAVTSASLPPIPSQTLQQQQQLQQPNPTPLADVDKGNIALPLQNRNVQPMPRVESSASKMSKVSSVPSFGKIHEPLSGSSIQLDEHPNHYHPNQTSDPKRITRITPAEYEEFGSEALITNVYDDLEEEFDDATPSALFRQIGPSISMAHGIHEKNPSFDNALPPRDTQVYRGENVHIVHQQSPPPPDQQPQATTPQPSSPDDRHSQPSVQPQTTAPSAPAAYAPPPPTTHPDNSSQPSANTQLHEDVTYEHVQQSDPPMSPPCQIGQLRGETGKIATPPPPPLPRAPLPPPVPNSNTVPHPTPPPPPPVADVRSYGEPAVPPPPSRPPPTSMHTYQDASDKSALYSPVHQTQTQYDGTVEYEGEVEQQYDYVATDLKDLSLHDVHRREDHRYTGEIGEAIVGHE